MINAAGGVQKVQTFLLGDSFEVPKFQRNYAWGARQIDDLWEDIAHAYRVDGAEHFIGSILLQSGENGERAAVIDGQQRLTTLFILLCRIRDEIYYLEDNTIDGAGLNANGAPVQLMGILNQFLVADVLTGEPRFVANERIHDDFRDGVLRDPKEHDEKRKTFTKRDRPETLNLRKAYWQLKGLVRDFVAIETASSGDPAKLVLYKLALTILNRLMILKVTCSNMAEAIDVYMTLNSTGLNLLSSDLVKSLLIKYSADIDKSAQDWNKILSNVGDKNIDQFLRYYLLVYGVSDRSIRTKEVYHEFESSIEKDVDLSKRRALSSKFMADLVKKSEIFGSLVGAIELQEHMDSFQRTLSGLSSVLDSYRTLFVPLFDLELGLSVQLRNELIRNSEALVLRWLIAGNNAQTLETNFQKWARDLVANKDTVGFADVTSQIIMEMKLKNPKDQLIRERLTETVDDPKLARFIMFSFGERLGNEGQMVAFDSEKIHVEHIAPQSGAESWPAKLGIKNFNKPEGQIAYRELCELLGNKTVLDHKINKQIQAAEFDVKKKGKLKSGGKDIKGYVESTLSVARDLVNISDWTRDEILSRNEWAIECFIATWRVGEKQGKIQHYSVWAKRAS